MTELEKIKNVRATVRQKEEQRLVDEQYASQFNSKYHTPEPDRHDYRLYLSDDEHRLLSDLLEKEMARIKKLKRTLERENMMLSIQHIKDTLHDN